MGLEEGKRAEALEVLLSTDDMKPWQRPAPLFADNAEKAEGVQLRCCATMDRTSATTRLIVFVSMPGNVAAKRGETVWQQELHLP
jgi:hypothetical protein